MADLATLQQKYEPVLKAIDHFTPEGAALQDVSLDGDKHKQNYCTESGGAVSPA